MPARNGTGPQGQGSRTGRGMGNCSTSKAKNDQSLNADNNQPVLGSGRRLGNWINNFFNRRRANRFNRK
ncbi:MAG: hypothetical protein FP831_05370 [Anaerolineae bacterium]|nr:hypothetical protein [Anaerolineae bacterium]